MIGESLLRFNKEQLYAAWDFETEGLNAFFSRPIQASWVIFTLNDIIEEYDSFIKWPDLRMSADAAAVNRFDEDEYWAKARPAEEVLGKWEEVASNASIKLVGHNILPFDSLIHQVWRRELGKSFDYSYLTRCIDTLALARAYRKGITPVTSSPEEFLAWQYRMLSISDKKMKCSLGALGKEFKIEHNEGELHNSLADTRLNAGVFRELVYKVDV